MQFGTFCRLPEILIIVIVFCVYRTPWRGYTDTLLHSLRGRTVTQIVFVRNKGDTFGVQVAQKVSHYQESPLNRIKKPPVRLDFFISFEYKMSARILWVCIQYSMCHVISDVISCCVWSCNMGKINVAYMIKSWLKTRKKEKILKWYFLHKSPPRRWLRSGIHSLLRRSDARWSADVIYITWGISLLCRSGIVIGVQK